MDVGGTDAYTAGASNGWRTNKFSAGVLWAASTKVFISRDTGTSWIDVTPLQMSSPDIVRSIEAINGTTAIISTHQQNIFKTTDGGSTWSRITIPSGATDYINFIDNNPDWLVAASGGLMSSLDGGITWRTAPGIPDFLQSVVCRRNSPLCYAIAGTYQGGASLYRTTNLGLSWQRFPGTIDFDVYSFTMGECDSNKFFAVNEEYGGPKDGWASVFSSSNTGVSWTKNTQFITNWTYTGAIVRADNILYVQKISGIERSTDDAVNWVSIAGPGNILDTRTLCAVSGNIVLAADETGNVYRTINSGGDSLKLANSPSSANIQLDKTTLFVFDTISKCDSLDRTFSVRNIGCGSIGVLSAQFTGPAAGDYSLIGTVPTELSGFYSFKIRLNPTDTLLREASFVITLADNSTRVVTLKGFVRGAIGVQVVTPQQIVLGDTLGQVIEVPITFTGLEERQGVALIIRYDSKYLDYKGTRSLSGLLLDVDTAITNSGRARIFIPASQMALTNGPIAFSRFIVYGAKAATRTSITFDSLSFPTATPSCKYTSVFSSAGVDLIHGCGINILSDFLRGRTLNLLYAYPNPTRGVVTLVSTANIGQVRLNVIDAAGSILLRKDAELSSDNRTDLDLTSLLSGVYYITVEGFNQKASIVLEK